MALSDFSGPLVQHGGGMTTTGEYNPERGPALIDMGVALLDPRKVYTYRPGQRVGRATYGFLAVSPMVIDATPSALSATNIAAAQVPVAATPMTLVSSSGAGITVGTSITRGDTGAATAATLLAIDTAMAGVGFGDSGLQTVNMWDPSKAIARNLRFTSAGNDSSATATISGFDLYGFPMTETVTLANAGIAAGKKAFKYISSITPAGSLSGSNLSVGTGDVIGIPLRADRFGNVEIVYNNGVITANTGYLAADTNTATATTGDVRGTYALQSSSDGTKTLQMRVMVTPANMALATTTGLFGVTQA